MYYLLHRVQHLIAGVFFSWLLATQALAAQSGWRQLTLASDVANTAPMVVALYYPTQAPARSIAMGPFTVNVAIGALPEAIFKGLIVISHGTGGTELGHTSLAQALAQNGYLVAALRHPGDNWRDRSLLQTGANYFTQRPQQVSRVIDALLRDPLWGDRIAKDARGPVVGVLGHSAGGYTALALAGAQPDSARIAVHCNSHRVDDPIFCSMKRASPALTGGAAVASRIAEESLFDARVRAVVALAPVGVVFSSDALGKVRIPVALYGAELDSFLVPRFHADWVARHVVTTQSHSVKNAGHFAFMDTPNMPVASEDGDIGANPTGFDRQAFLQQLGADITAFFDKALR